MKLKHVIIAGAVAIAACLFLTACNSVVTVYEPMIGADGKPITDAKGEIVMKKTITAKESPAAHKTFSVSGSATALKVETAGSAASETASPNFFVGGSTASLSSTAAMTGDENSAPTAGYSESCGFLNSLTNVSATSKSFTYTGVKGETAEETAKRIKAIRGLSESTSVDSGTSN